MRHVFFIVGPPGVGKTTLMRALIEGADPLRRRYFVDKPKWTILPATKWALAGHYKGDTFDGADTVPYNGVKMSLEFWAYGLRETEVTFLDGDRFSHPGALTWFRENRGQLASLRIVHLTAPQDVLEARRAARGSNQNPAWIKGRETKALRFAELDAAAIRLDATARIETLLTQLAERVEPIGRVLLPKT